MNLPFSFCFYSEFLLLCFFFILLCVAFTLLSSPVVFMRGVFGLTALLSAPSGRPGYCSLRHPLQESARLTWGAGLLLPLRRCAEHQTAPRSRGVHTHDLETHDLKARPLIYLYSRFLFFFPSQCSQDFSFAISSVFRILFPGGTHSLSMGLLATNSPFFFFFLLKVSLFPLNS